MLDAYIIDAIRREERADKERERVWLELPLDPRRPNDRPEQGDSSPSERVVIIPLHDDVEDDDDDDPESEAA